MAQLQPNRIFAGRYLLLDKLGIGGFSEVWKATDQMTEDTVVALKVYAPEKGLDDAGNKQFRREYAITMPLSHPGLLKAYHFDVSDDSPYLVMPYCSRGSLGSALMNDGPLSEHEVARVLLQVGDALNYLHGKETLHQDIKPDNILIDDDGNYLVTDFGISSRLRGTLSRFTNSQAITVAYAPPERFAERPQNTPASDIFSLGVMLYELCTGDVPWLGQGGMVLRYDSVLPLLPDNYSTDLTNIIRACLRFEPSQRPTAYQLRQSAQNYLQKGRWDLTFLGYSHVAQPFTPPTPQPQPGRQTEVITTPKPQQVALEEVDYQRGASSIGLWVGATLLILVGFGSFYYINYGRGTPANIPMLSQDSTAIDTDSAPASLASQNDAAQSDSIKAMITPVSNISEVIDENYVFADNEVDVVPQFPGGKEEYNMYIRRNLNFPSDAKAANKTGVCTVQFMVDADGSIHNVAPAGMKDGTESMMREAVRLIEEMPHWTPGQISGDQVKVRTTVKVAFKL